MNNDRVYDLSNSPTDDNRLDKDKKYSTGSLSQEMWKTNL